MKESFQKLYQASKQDRKNSTWSREQTLSSRFEHLQKEIKEISEALENGDLQNLKEEIGDLFWNVFGVLAIAEEKNHFTVKEVFDNINNKIKRRKPWIFNGETVDLDEEVRRWREAKEIENIDKAKTYQKRMVQVKPKKKNERDRNQDT